jgi:hypothetical protein
MRGKIKSGARSKSSKYEEEGMVGRDGIEPPTPGLLILCLLGTTRTINPVLLPGSRGSRNLGNALPGSDTVST